MTVQGFQEKPVEHFYDSSSLRQKSEASKVHLVGSWVAGPDALSNIAAVFRLCDFRDIARCQTWEVRGNFIKGGMPIHLKTMK